MNRFLIYISLICCLFSLNAQQDPDARKILERVALKVNAMSSMKISYSFIYEDLKTNQKNEDKGEIYIKGEKYKIAMATSDIYYDGKNMWTFLKEAKEVNVIKADYNENDVTNPKNLFTLYDKDYKYAYLGEETLHGVLMEKIDLYPNSLDVAYSRIRLYVSKTDELKRAKVFYKNGSSFTFIIKEIIAGQPYNDSFFKFNEAENPDVEVIDMRF
jgi:outer membrane lipoprotein carrier protein